MTDRAQTVYDYLLGTVLVLVTIIIVLSLFPQLFGPFTEPVGTDRDDKAERIATQMIETNATADGDRVLDLDESAFEDDSYISSIRNDSGVSDFRGVNVTLQNQTAELGTAGDERRSGEPEATSTRNVRLADSDLEGCEVGCYLIVRVW